MIQFHSFPCSCTVFPAPFIKETVFFPLDVCSCFVKDSLPKELRVHFWVLYSVPLFYVSVFVPVPCCVCDHSFVVCLKSSNVMPPALFFLFNNSLVIQCLFWFHTNLRAICSSSLKNVLGILIGIALKV